MLRRKVCVPARHGYRLVAHELLNSPQTNPGHDQPAGEGVPEAVPGKIHDTGLPAGGVKPFPRRAAAWR